MCVCVCLKHTDGQTEIAGRRECDIAVCRWVGLGGLQNENK